MLNRPFKSVIARIAIFALALSLVVPFVLPAALAQSAGTSVSYPENGVEPVAVFVASDQDGDPIEWSLNGDDADLFAIDGGVLAFKESPNYESPQAQATGTLADRNVYVVTLKATGGEHDVTVTVEDVDEDGSVSLNKPQPQAGRGLLATLEDPEGSTDEAWQWARSEDGETWEDIEGAASASRSPVAADVGSYLRATVVYEDSFGAGKSASVVSDNRVEAKTVANAAPSFEDQQNDDGTVTRSVDENASEGTNVGKAVSASDADNDILIYSIVEDAENAPGASDDEKFTIDSSTGQLKVNAKFDFETPNDVGGTASDNVYVITVKAEDPSGAMGTQDVNISVGNLNEAPTFMEGAPVTLWVTEKDASKQLRTDEDDTTATLRTDAYDATDRDTADTTVTYSLEGDDAKKFDIDSSDSALTVSTSHEPDHEEQGSYSITIVATSGADDRKLTSRLNVTVNVTDAEDAGSISLSQREPQVSRPVTATLSDADGGVTSAKWQWYKGTDKESAFDNFKDAAPPAACDDDDDAAASALCTIEGATSSTYVPTDDDAGGDRLSVRVTYTDNIGEADVAVAILEKNVQTSNAANTAPAFPDQDANTPGDQSEETSRSVAENTDAGVTFGDAVSASDANGDALIHTLSGADADSFGIDRDNGQLETKAALDYETKNEYMVMVTATDPSGAADSIMVTINVTDENDLPVIQEETAVQQAGSVTLSTDSPAVGEAVTASLSDGNAPVSDAQWQWASSSDGETWADIEGAMEASYTPVMEDSGMMLQASVAYTDAVTSGQSASAATANAVNNAPAFGADSASRSIDETAASGANVGAPVAATDANGDEIAYSLEGDGAESFAIDSAGQITLAEGASLDYETTTGYSLTVNATDPSGASASVAVAIAVNNQGLDNAYDLDDSGDISKDEAVQAVQDYFADTITRGEVLEVLQLYFAG